MEEAGVRPQEGQKPWTGSICLYTLKFKDPESTVLDWAGLGGERQNTGGSDAAITVV